MNIIVGSAFLRRGLLGIFLSLLGSMMAAEPIKSFDIAAGAAERALKQFALQSGMEVLFSTEVARGVRTNAVKGDFVVHEAVRLMLSGTPLRMINDSKNGVLRIARDPGPNGDRAAPKATRGRPIR